MSILKYDFERTEGDMYYFKPNTAFQAEEIDNGPIIDIGEFREYISQFKKTLSTEDQKTFDQASIITKTSSNSRCLNNIWTSFITGFIQSIKLQNINNEYLEEIERKLLDINLNIREKDSIDNLHMTVYILGMLDGLLS